MSIRPLSTPATTTAAEVAKPEIQGIIVDPKSKARYEGATLLGKVNFHWLHGCLFSLYFINKPDVLV